MKIVLTAFDVLAVLFSFALAVQIGGRYSPNFLLVVLVFFAIRLLLQWLYFRTFVLRVFPLFRSSLQFGILVPTVFVLLFVTSVVPSLGKFLTQDYLTYYVFVPVVTVLISFLLQRYIEIEG